MSKYSFDQYITRLGLSKKLYLNIENLLLDFLEFVPLECEHLDIYSLKLVTIILETGPELLNSFDLAIFYETGVQKLGLDSSDEDRQKLLDKEQTLRDKNRSLTFQDYLGFLNKHKNFYPTKIFVPDIDAYITPFKNTDWWECYNLLRHDKYDNIKKATLRNSLKTLGALFHLISFNYNYRTHAEEVASTIFSDNDSSLIDHRILKEI